MLRSIILSLVICVFGAQYSFSAEPLDLSFYEGKLVYVDFWASWCKPCQKSFPWMVSMKNKYGKDGLVILAVNVDSDRRLASEFIKTHDVSGLKIIYDVDSGYAEHYDLVGMPSSLLFDRQGKLVHQEAGFNERKMGEYEHLISTHL